MADISPSVVMSASQRAKKVSVQDDEPLAAWITEVIETLSRPIGAVRVAEDHVTDVREQLADLSETGGEVDSQILEPIIEIFEKDITSCRRLRPAAFSLFIEVLLATQDSVVRARGLYILGKSLNVERATAPRKDLFQGRLDLIGQGCLRRLYDQFTEKSVPYNSRRWMGTLMLELIAECEDNQQIIALMPTTKRAKLGSSILYESSEILRSITGRIVTMILGAEHPIKQFFPPGTAERLFEKYPSPAQSASQWDKTFQEYVDEIWEDICAENESNGELQFAQDIVTEPHHYGIKAVAATHRSIYIELGETLRIYIHSGKDSFDSAIDVPFASICGVTTALTAADLAQQFHPVDVVLTMAPTALCFVDSLQSSLSTLKLTVQDQEIADGIVDGISRMIANYEKDEVEQQVAASSPAGTNSQGSSQGKVSCTEEDLVLDGSYTVVNDSFVEVVAAPVNANSKSSDEIDAEQTIYDESKMVAFQEKEAESLSKKTDTKVADSSTVITATVGKKKPMPREEPAPVSRIMAEIAIVRDMDNGQVLTSKFPTIGVVPPKDYEVHDDTAAKSASIALESSDQLTGDRLNSSSDSPQELPTTTEDSLEAITELSAPQKKQPLKFTAPQRGLKTDKESAAEVEPRGKQDNIAPKREIKILHHPQGPAEAPHKARLVAPTKKPTKVSAKAHPLKRIEDVKDVDEIYNVCSSPPRAKMDTKTQLKGKKAVISGVSTRMPGGRRKGADEGAKEHTNVVEPKNPVSRAKKDSSKRKPLQKAIPQTAATASRIKRASALRSTKGKKSMKDLSDSEIEELVVEEASIMEQVYAVKDKDEGVADKSVPAAQDSDMQNQTTEVPNGVFLSQEEENTVKSAPRVHDSDDRTKTAGSHRIVAKTDQKPSMVPIVPKKDVIGQPITRQRALDNEPEEPQSQAEEQEISPPVEQDESHDVSRGATVAASLEESDDLDIILTPTADAQKPAGTVEAKIGRKMADIFRFASANIMANEKKELRDVRSSQKSRPTGPKSSPSIEYKAKSPEVVVDSHVAALPLVESDEIQAVQDGDEFIVLSSPPQIIETEMEKDISKVAAPSPAQELIVVSDSDEESREPLDRDKISAEKHSLAAPSVDNPSQRQRVAKPVWVSSPLQPVVVRVSRRGAIKAKVQARKQATLLPKSSPRPALVKEHAPSVDQSILVNGHQTRKTPMIAFGPSGPRNQGLPSAWKPVRATKQVEPSTLSGIFEKPGKRSADEKPFAEQAGKMLTGGLRPQPQVLKDPGSNDSITRFRFAGSVNRSNKDDEGIAFFKPGQSVASSRSYSRVDVNGSPQPKRASAASGGPLSRVTKNLSFAPTAAKAKTRPQRDTIPVEKFSNDGTAFDDDITLFGSGFLSNRKVRPAPPEDELDFESRYTPHHSAGNGTYLGVNTQNVVDAAAHITDPFSNKVKRQDSGFARKLRTSVDPEGRAAGQSHVPPTAKARTRVQSPEKLLPHPSRLRSLVDAGATLVNIENQPPRQPRRSGKEESNSDSTDSEVDALEQDELATPTPQEIWREALKPHQQDVSDVLHHVVDGLLQQLIDKEPAIQAIAEQYRDNGTQIVEGLKSKMAAEIQRLNAHATSTIEDLAQSLRQSRSELKASLGGSKELDDQYKAWRARQHDLQSLPFMARLNSGRLS